MFTDLFGQMAPETSTYQAFKIWLAGYVPIDRDLLHIIFGAGVLAIAVIGSGWRRGAVGAFVVTLVLAVGMEAIDRRDDIALTGTWRWGESVTDVIRTVLVPALAVAWLRLRRRPLRQ